VLPTRPHHVSEQLNPVRPAGWTFGGFGEVVKNLRVYDDFKWHTVGMMDGELDGKVESIRYPHGSVGSRVGRVR